MDKREFIKNYIDDIENEDSISFIYHFVRGHIDKVWEKERELKMQNNNLDEIIIKLLKIQNKLK